MIKAVLFDYGGVISRGGGGHELTDRLGAVLGVSGDEAYQYLSPYWQLYDTGKIAEETIWTNIEQAIGRSIPLDQRAIWNTWEHMQPIPEMIALINELKQVPLRVGLLSNVIPNTKQEIRSHGGYKLFDFTVLSDEVGYAKPDITMYEIALEQLPGIAPEEVVFVDDQERLLAPALRLGMRTVLALNSAQIAQDLKAML